MDLSHHLSISYYKQIAVINEPHKIYLVQHQETLKFYVKKILDVYNIEVYEYLFNHPVTGTPGIVDYYESDNTLTIIEEFISGNSLQEIISNRSLTVNDIVLYISDLCDILEQLHSIVPPVIHRDIKPSNIIISNSNHALLLDFNAAKYYSRQTSKDTTLLGTQGYAAPEQYGFGSSSPQTDIYSLGVVLKEMVSSLPTTCKLFDPIIEKCTKLNPTERYRTIKDLKVVISELFPQKTDEKHKSFAPPGYRTKKPWKMIIATVGYILIILLSLSISPKNITGTALWLERCFIFLMMISFVLCCFNYRNIRNIFSLCKHRLKIVRFFGVVILITGIISLLIIILVLIETIFGI